MAKKNSFNSLFCFQKHMNWHQENQGFVCNHCNFPFHDKQQYQNHLELHKTKSSLLVCVFCDKVYISEQCLKNHTSRHVSFNILHAIKNSIEEFSKIRIK